MDKKSISPEQLKRQLPESESEKKQSPEDMIRALKGIFCKGRYSSWVATQGVPSFKNLQSARKHRKSTLKK